MSVQNSFEHLARGFRTWKLNKRNWTHLLCHLMLNQLMCLTTYNRKSVSCKAMTSSRLDIKTFLCSSFINCMQSWGFPHSEEMCTEVCISNRSEQPLWIVPFKTDSYKRLSWLSEPNLVSSSPPTPSDIKHLSPKSTNSNHSITQVNLV